MTTVTPFGADFSFLSLLYIEANIDNKSFLLAINFFTCFQLSENWFKKTKCSKETLETNFNRLRVSLQGDCLKLHVHEHDFLMRISASKWANRFVVEITLLKCNNMLSWGPTPGSFDIIGFTNRLLQVWKHDWKVFFKCFNAKMNWMLTNRN